MHAPTLLSQIVSFVEVSPFQHFFFKTKGLMAQIQVNTQNTCKKERYVKSFFFLITDITCKVSIVSLYICIIPHFCLWFILYSCMQTSLLLWQQINIDISSLSTVHDLSSKAKIFILNLTYIYCLYINYHIYWWQRHLKLENLICHLENIPQGHKFSFSFVNISVDKVCASKIYYWLPNMVPTPSYSVTLCKAWTFAFLASSIICKSIRGSGSWFHTQKGQRITEEVVGAYFNSVTDSGPENLIWHVQQPGNDLN